MIVDATINDVPTSAVVFVAVYDADSGELLDVSEMSRYAKTEFVCYPGLDATYEGELRVKVFVWDNSTAMRPLCEPMEVETTLDF